MTPTARLAVLGFAALAFGCAEAPTAPDAEPAEPDAAVASKTGGFQFRTATPESQGMCGSSLQLGCTTTLQDIWREISKPIHNTKRFIVVRNDRVVFSQGTASRYPVYSASKGLLGGPTLVYAMSRCGVDLGAPASRWLGHGDGARWRTLAPWSEITVEHLANHTGGVCDHENPSAVCRNETPKWQTTYDRGRSGGANYVYPNDMFTIARAKSEQNREPALPPGSVYEYSNVGHALLNYVVQQACGLKLTDIYERYIKQSGMGSPAGVPLIRTDGGRVFNQSTGVARWEGLHGAAILRLVGRRGIWDNRNVEPVRYWDALTRPGGNAAAAEVGWGVVLSNNSTDMWTAPDGYQRLSPETFGHGGNYSNIFINDPLTGTIVVRQGVNNATGASYLTQNGCAPGWTGTAPTCTRGTNWSNNWGVPGGSSDFVTVGPRKKVVDPLQGAFFFPPPYCRMTSAGGNPVDAVTSVYAAPAGAPTIDLEAEITVSPREGGGGSAAYGVEFYAESNTGAATLIGRGVPVDGTSPERYRLAYAAASHGSVGTVRTYFASCIAASSMDESKRVPSYSRPVRVSRN